MTKHRRALFTILALTCVSIPLAAKAGANSAELECQTATTGVTLAGTIPRDALEIELTLDDGKGHTTTWSNTDELVMSDHVADHVLLMQIDAATKLKYWALPKTMKVKSKRHQEDATFEAKATVVGFAGDTSPRELQLACTYHYSI